MRMVKFEKLVLTFVSGEQDISFAFSRNTVWFTDLAVSPFYTFPLLSVYLGMLSPHPYLVQYTAHFQIQKRTLGVWYGLMQCNGKDRGEKESGDWEEERVVSLPNILKGAMEFWCLSKTNCEELINEILYFQVKC